MFVFVGDYKFAPFLYQYQFHIKKKKKAFVSEINC